MNIVRASRYFYLKLIRIKGNPHAVALGAAIGVFIGITPTIPLHTAIIFFLTIVTRSSFIAGLTTSWVVSNPLTYIPLYYLSLKIGNMVTPYSLNWETVKSVIDLVLSDATFATRLDAIGTLGVQAIVVMMIGGCLLGLPFSIVSYYLFRSLIKQYRHKRYTKHILH